MTNVKIAFKFLDKDVTAPVGYTKIRCHIIFDMKMDRTRTTRFATGGHHTDPPAKMIYASVVSRENIRIALLVAALNELDLLAGGIGTHISMRIQLKRYIILLD